METKSDLRNRILRNRSVLSPQAVCEKSGNIFNRLYSTKHYEDTKIVLAYMSFRNEVSTELFIRKCLADGKIVAIPRVEHHKGTGSQRILTAYRINELDKDIISGYKGIPEPDTTILNKMDPREIDLAIIPGVVFDYSRYRIGYGAGYYDRFLSSLGTDCLKAGIAYDMQMIDKIPYEEHDIPMDIVVTETGVY